MEDLNVQTIAIPVEEYKELLQKQAELSHLSQGCTRQRLRHW